MGTRLKPYSHQEDEIMLNYLITNDLYSRTAGKSIWKSMEEELVLERSWMSMRARFKKVVMQLYLYDIPMDAKNKLRGSIHFKMSRLSDSNSVEEIPVQTLLSDTENEKEIDPALTKPTSKNVPIQNEISTDSDISIVVTNDDDDLCLRNTLPIPASSKTRRQEILRSSSDSDDSNFSKTVELSNEECRKMLEYIQEDESRLKHLKKDNIYVEMAMKLFDHKYTWSALKSCFLNTVLLSLNEYMSDEEVKEFYAKTDLNVPYILKLHLKNSSVKKPNDNLPTRENKLAEILRSKQRINTPAKKSNDNFPKKAAKKLNDKQLLSKHSKKKKIPISSELPDVFVSVDSSNENDVNETTTETNEDSQTIIDSLEKQNLIVPYEINGIKHLVISTHLSLENLIQLKSFNDRKIINVDPDTFNKYLICKQHANYFKNSFEGVLKNILQQDREKTAKSCCEISKSLLCQAHVHFMDTVLGINSSQSSANSDLGTVFNNNLSQPPDSIAMEGSFRDSLDNFMFRDFNSPKSLSEMSDRSYTGLILDDNSQESTKSCETQEETQNNTVAMEDLFEESDDASEKTNNRGEEPMEDSFDEIDNSFVGIQTKEDAIIVKSELNEENEDIIEISSKDDESEENKDELDVTMTEEFFSAEARVEIKNSEPESSQNLPFYSPQPIKNTLELLKKTD